ncbi:endoglucanase [Novosphingobium chloroacetimidivorans]|uniref:cellulase n=1 Tax=Novosphingobium chloroacetimidivorans TaxID=1428314 RepID=A0A7W7NVA0_9SPHN|nr:glycosyl hydrolase family 8 [Novosphingobium chloroacetimidivorans]MBB4858036.1 endoglucanase [Novosphingobium chloroacetimidivorans]
MAVDRRKFALGLAVALTAACSTGVQSYAEPAGGWWRIYRQRFLDRSGRIVDTGNGGISHSEGQGYGMILAALSEDREAFAAMFRWTEATLGGDDLYAWRYDPRQAKPVGDPNNATDGDILIAWALALAGQRWKVGSYLDRSAAVRAAIRRDCVVERFGRQLLLPGRAGFASAAEVTVNPSYYVWPALDTFARLDGAATWGGVISSGEALLRQARFGPLHLPCDWVAVSGPTAVTPARDKPSRFGYDAIRVPLYAIMGGRKALVNDVAAWWRAVLAQRRPVPAWIDVVTGEEAPYALSSGGAAIVSRLIGSPAPVQLDSDYFSASLQMLAGARL